MLCFRELFSPAQKYQLLVYHADAIFHDKEYRNAACKYSMALQQKKVLSKTSKVRTSTGGAASNIQAQVCPSSRRVFPHRRLFSSMSLYSCVLHCEGMLVLPSSVVVNTSDVLLPALSSSYSQSLKQCLKFEHKQISSSSHFLSPALKPHLQS